MFAIALCILITFSVMQILFIFRKNFKVFRIILGDQFDAPYNSQGVPLSQLRKLQLSDDDRALMNKVKNQGEIFYFLIVIIFFHSNFLNPFNNI